MTLINTFPLEPSQAEELFAALFRATENGMRQRRGFVSVTLHVSHDRRHVANYAKWRCQEDLDAMNKDPAAQVLMREAACIATSFTSVYYDLRETHSAEAA